ncbi:bifunctional folylpolyglutamate synthase/dihydrofolate synthase [Rhodopseudomonas sp. HC1]|uniref:bifunctional folylpolyglutamate synthase/dihydrofolate synthase n=1 Tax=Rhodopseudomonas infernalis TaxID=2897386 RepID=UPI001EE8490C|nr:folylpolyglutamate synthase/dihydrofolate synthase family protein [Rhodopseudomonas infernalis]MCG6207891.1 bifunctional folylpolyglutamate synthase/dihydrofolate synthase [Rhodopseudomonas infernalis]
MSAATGPQPSVSVGDLRARLAQLHPAQIDLTLGRVERLLAALDHPERRLPPVIHIAGTNGKGSTLAFLRAILEAAGLNVHAYTSPHLVRVNETIRLGRPGGGVLVGDDQLADALAHCERVNGGAPITLFEIETVAALWLFAQHPADVLLLEVGLGGRLDATNVIEHPLACVLTPIGIDHTEFLGPTLTDIATEKAGILRRGAPAIVAAQDDAAMAVIEREAQRQRAPLFACGQQWHVQIEHGRLAYQDERGLLDLTAPKLFGRHQIDNAGLAIATLRAQTRFSIDQAAYQAGLLSAEWPARMQRITTGKLLGDAPQGCELWLDGAHNADGGRIAAAALGDLEERVSRPLVLIAGMMANKDAHAFLTNFTGLTRHIITVPIPDRAGAMPPEALADAGRALGFRVERADGIEAALRRIAGLAYELPPRILITGSLYLAGHVLDLNGTPPS